MARPFKFADGIELKKIKMLIPTVLEQEVRKSVDLICVDFLEKKPITESFKNVKLTRASICMLEKIINREYNLSKTSLLRKQELVALSVVLDFKIYKK